MRGKDEVEEGKGKEGRRERVTNGGRESVMMRKLNKTNKWNEEDG